MQSVHSDSYTTVTNPDPDTMSQEWGTTFAVLNMANSRIPERATLKPYPSSSPNAKPMPKPKPRPSPSPIPIPLSISISISLTQTLTRGVLEGAMQRSHTVWHCDAVWHCMALGVALYRNV